MKTDAEYCCAQFAEEALTPHNQGFEKHEDGTWAINGCCGGGCYVVNQMKYCPFCGTATDKMKE